MDSAGIKLEIPERSVQRSASPSLAASRVPYTIRALDLKRHKDVVLGIWRKSIPPIPEAKYSWMYEGNPYGPAVGWLLVDAAGEAVGMTALFPRKVRIEGRDQMAAVAGDFVVNREHRTLGPALMLQKAVVEDLKKHDFDLVYGFPNRPAE